MSDSETACKHNIDGWDFDLSPLQASQPYVYTGLAGRVYTAGGCGEDSAVERECGMPLAVAGLKGACEWFGSLESAGPPRWLDPHDPNAGMKVTYGDGVICAFDASMRTSATFIYRCDKSSTLPGAMLTAVREPRETQIKCNYEFDFNTPYACPTGPLVPVPPFLL